ncbi:MAG TPA: APC family permease [Chitinophagaceae bacterium]|nr:APC family permease [Chitinophagaceae bacterium]
MSLQNLPRKINLLQASSFNMIDMVGIGPFVVMPLVIGFFNTNLFFWAWVFGGFIAFMDGMIWAELGAKYPLAGGTYNFHRVAFGEKGGKLMSFLFVWQTSIQAPLVAASASIGFAQYLHYLVPGNYSKELISVVLILLVTFLLYRRIDVIGKISVVLGAIVIMTILWIIFSGFSNRQVHYSFLPDHFGEFFKISFWMAMGQASVKTVYSYLGYYNVCHVGGEIMNPEKNIPRSIFLSIVVIGLLYLCMNIAIVSVIPWWEAQHSDFVVSIFFEKIYGNQVAKMATALVLLAAFSSLFALLLGYSRIPYAAAVDGNFFRIFSKLHPTKNFPYVSLLFISGLAIIFACSFSLQKTISAILAMRIIIQFIGQAVGVVLLRKRFGTKDLPFKMWLYPLPVILSICIWLFLFICTGWFALWGILIAISGVVVFFISKRFQKKSIGK